MIHEGLTLGQAAKYTSYLQDIAGHLPKPRRDPVTVDRPADGRPQNQQIERAGKQVGAEILSSHRLSMGTS
jgi:hypothetical protein